MSAFQKHTNVTAIPVRSSNKLSTSPAKSQCYFTVDCKDGSDEKDCPMPECSDDELKCDLSGACLPFRFRCDGEFDCGPGDESDETDCGEK